MSEPLAALHDAATIRLRCGAVTRAVERGVSTWFSLDRSRLDDVAARVAALIRQRFPDSKVPPHGCWRLFNAGNVDRRAELEQLLAPHAPADRARAMIDLSVVSVLLDADVGANWRYHDQSELGALALPVQRHGRDELLALLDHAASQPVDSAPLAAPVASVTPGVGLAGSEGIAVASLRAFMGGAFSSMRDDPCRADAAALRLVDAAALRAVFQAGPTNPFTGLGGRAGILARLGQTLQATHERDGRPARPSGIIDHLTAGFTRDALDAATLLGELLRSFEPIWPSGHTKLGRPLGDAWPHRWAGADCTRGSDPFGAGWVPLHAQGQRLVYSLVEPLEWAGVRLTGLEQLTGLPDRRSGGLLIDGGVIVPRAAADLERAWKPGDEIVVEWRALTVTLLDELAARVRRELGAQGDGLSMSALLEGGTMEAGRAIAAERRDGRPPLVVESDGTLF